MNIPEGFIPLVRERGDGPVSFSTDTSLYVSAAGSVTASVDVDDFIELPKTLLADVAASESPVDELIGRRPAGTDRLPPGAETLVHSALEAPVVVHIRGTAVAGMLAGAAGERFLLEHFPGEALWTPLLAPDGTSISALQAQIQQFRSTHNGNPPAVLAIMNHGLLVTGTTPLDVANTIDRVKSAVEAAIRRRPDTAEQQKNTDALEELRHAVSRALADTRAAHGAALTRPMTSACTSPEILRRTASAQAFEPLRTALMTEHLVHLGHSFCFVPRHGDVNSPQALLADVLHGIHDFYNEELAAPRVVAIEGGAVVIVGETEEELHDACFAFDRALEIACYAESFGGARGIPLSYMASFRDLPVPSSETT
ncbi:MAG: hypothetical protein ACLFR8_04590 [Alkalispirochaeta sp.]